MHSEPIRQQYFEPIRIAEHIGVSPGKYSEENCRTPEAGQRVRAHMERVQREMAARGEQYSVTQPQRKGLADRAIQYMRQQPDRWFGTTELVKALGLKGNNNLIVALQRHYFFGNLDRRGDRSRFEWQVKANG